MKLTKVLVPIDNSEFCMEVVPHLTQILEPSKTELMLLHVEPMPNSITVEDRVVVYADQVAASKEAECKVAIQPYVESLEAVGYHVTPFISFGDPAKEIEHFAEKQDVDLVAMTTHGRTGFSRLLHGSVAQHVFGHVGVPVFLYRGVSEDGWDGTLGE